jgi:hypothetical protein
MACLTVLYFDCFSGASGDMILGALIDLGVPLDAVRDALGDLAVDRGTIWTERTVRAGVSATWFRVQSEGHDATGRTHAHPHVAGDGTSSVGHRSLAEISELIERSRLGVAGRRRARELFATLGQVEADIHGVAVEQVHLHEVGALDSIIDIVGIVFAMEYLGVERTYASPLNVGSGTVRTSHGDYPVPAPATMRLLEGVPIYAGPQPFELVTPTGALIVAGYALDFGHLPAMTVRRTGYGAGSRDIPSRPNVLRAVLGEEARGEVVQAVAVIEAEIDDMNPQLFGAVMDGLLAQGALDVFYTPVQMKKNRPGTLLTVLSRPEARDQHVAYLFRETTTLGVRYHEMQRECLEREQVAVETLFGSVAMKVARRDGRVCNVSPEYEDCLRLARAADAPVKDVQAAALKAYFDSVAS